MANVDNSNPITERNQAMYETLTNSRGGLLSKLYQAKVKMNNAMLRLALSNPNNISGIDKFNYYTSQTLYNKLNMELDLLDSKRFDLTHGLFI